MFALNYERLKGITQSVQPYRGSTNRYPIAYRSQNNKYFLVEERNGEQIYRIVYGTRWRSVEMDKQEYDAYVLSGSGDYYDRPKFENGVEVGKQYYRYVKEPNEVGIVRADNTFEFTKDAYFQGEKQVMTGWCNGILYSSSRHGGMVYAQNHDKVFHPIWKGMRVDCNTFKPTQDYKVIGRRVSRKDAKQYLGEYQDFYKIAESMLKAMDCNSFVGLAGDVLQESGILNQETQGWYIGDTLSQLIASKARELMHDAPMDAVAMFCVAFNIESMWRRAQAHIDPTQNSWYGRQEFEVANMFTALRTRINKDLYRANKDVMKEVEFPMGERYPASEWGYDIVVNDVEVQQYN